MRFTTFLYIIKHLTIIVQHEDRTVTVYLKTISDLVYTVNYILQMRIFQ